MSDTKAQSRSNPSRGFRSERVRPSQELKSLGLSLAFAAVFTLPLFVLEMGSHLVPAIHVWVMETIGMEENRYLQFALASLVLFGPGLRFFQKGVPSLFRWTPDMNSLVVLGTTAAYGYSVIATFFAELLPEGTENVYYEAAAIHLFLHQLGPCGESSEPFDTELRNCTWKIPLDLASVGSLTGL
jgi:Cu+-exporting ATPase